MSGTDPTTPERTRLQRQAVLDLLAEQVPAHLWATDRDLRVTYVTGSVLTMLGIEPGAYLGSTLYELVADRPALLAAHARALGGEPAEYEYEHEAHGRVFEARVHPFRDGDGTVIGCLGLALDVTERRRVEAKERRAVRRLRLLADGAPGFAIVILDTDGRVAEWNAGARDVFGYQAEEIVGQPAAMLWTPEDRQSGLPERELATAAREGRAEDDNWAVRQDGDRIWVSGVTLALSDGDLRGFAKIVRDQTGRKRAEQALAVQHAVGRVLGEASGLDDAAPRVLQAFGEGLGWDYGGLWLADPAGEALRCATTWHRGDATVAAFAAANLTATFAPDEGLPGTTWKNGQPRWIADTAAETRFGGMRQAAAAGLRSGLAVPVGPDGRVVAVAEFLGCEPREPDDGILAAAVTLGGQLGQFIERTRVEAELAARARQQAAIAELGQHALATPDTHAVMEETVDVVARTLGVEYCEVLELLTGGEALLLRAGVGWREGLVGRATVGSGIDSQAGYTLLHREPVVVADLRREARFRGPPLLHEHGVVSGLSVVIGDGDRPYGVLGAHTSERRAFTRDDANFLQAVANVLSAAIRRTEAEERLAEERAASARLAELDRLRREFFDSISHDLKTPLTAAGAALDLLGAGAALSQADGARLLANARRNVDRLAFLIDDLLAFNQLESGSLRLDRISVDLRDIVRDALGAVRPLLEQDGQTLEVDLPGPLPVTGDRRRLERVVINLLGNANRHTPAGTRIRVSGVVAAGEVRLAVEDSGPGIPEADLERIFHRFYRRGARGGAGLGLAIARSVVELHGGRLWAERRPEGSAFRLTLPVEEGWA